MIVLLVCVALLVVIIPAAILNAGNKEKHESLASDPYFAYHFKKEYEEGIKELHNLDEQYHAQLQYWKEFCAKYESMGEPTLRIGYPDYQKPMPWKYQAINIPYSEIEGEQDLEKQVDMLRDALSQMRLDHSIPSIGKCATFWKDARIAVLGREELTPEQVRFVKSNRNNPLKWIEVIVTTTQIERPTVSVFFEPGERNEADELKAAINAFKLLPQ